MRNQELYFGFGALPPLVGYSENTKSNTLLISQNFCKESRGQSNFDPLSLNSHISEGIFRAYNKNLKLYCSFGAPPLPQC